MIQDQSITRSKYVESDVAVRTTGKSYRYDVLSFYSSRNVFVSSRPMWCGKFVPPNSKRGAAGPGCGIEDELDHHVVLPAPSPSSFVKHCQQLGTTTSCLSVCLYQREECMTIAGNEVRGLSIYVLLRCVRKDEKCYGTSDRWKMIPVMLKLAYVSQRLFFIYWSRPCPLEEFLGGYGSWAYAIAPKAKPDMCIGIAHHQQQCPDQYLPD